MQGDLVVGIVTIVLLFVTSYNAWQTKRLAEEMRKDRRRQFLESSLEKAYSPLYEVFRKALIDVTRSRSVTFLQLLNP